MIPFGAIGGEVVDLLGDVSSRVRAGRRARRPRRMALKWAKDRERYVPYEMVSNKERRQFIYVFGEKEMDRILDEFRASMKERLE